VLSQGPVGTAADRYLWTLSQRRKGTAPRQTQPGRAVEGRRAIRLASNRTGYVAKEKMWFIAEFRGIARGETERQRRSVIQPGVTGCPAGDGWLGEHRRSKDSQLAFRPSLRPHSRCVLELAPAPHVRRHSPMSSCSTTTLAMSKAPPC